MAEYVWLGSWTKWVHDVTMMSTKDGTHNLFLRSCQNSWWTKSCSWKIGDHWVLLPEAPLQPKVNCGDGLFVYLFIFPPHRHIWDSGFRRASGTLHWSQRFAELSDRGRGSGLGCWKRTIDCLIEWIRIKSDQATHLCIPYGFKIYDICIRRHAPVLFSELFWEGFYIFSAQWKFFVFWTASYQHSQK